MAGLEAVRLFSASSCSYCDGGKDPRRLLTGWASNARMPPWSKSGAAYGLSTKGRISVLSDTAVKAVHALLFLFLSWPKEGKEAEGSFGNKAPLKVKPYPVVEYLFPI
ncbi:hypothetical protein Syun_023285 [Stephania yunnanensis]|uniref:Uncharacterized protein n=1 Tax=Stephania yunnanensis TaxID=152371 RepID=A0AAP0FNI8_9MAGN